MSKIKLPQETAKEFGEFARLREESKKATNALGRQKTVLKRVFTEGIKSRQFPVGTYVTHHGLRFDYNTTSSDYIPPEALFKKYEQGEITRDQLLKCISVSKTSVSTHIGSDVALALSDEKTGNTFDVRVSELPIDAPNESVIVTPDIKAPAMRRVSTGNVTSSVSPASRLRRMRKKINVPQ